MTIDTEIVTKIETKGLIDAADRILRELIRTPKFKEAVIILLNSIDPPAARSLVRTLFWQDPGLLLSIMGSLPTLINTGSEALAEVAAQMNSMSPLLLQEFLKRVFAGLDGAPLGEAAGGLVAMLLSLELSEADNSIRKSLTEIGEEFGQAYGRTVGENKLTGRLDGWVAGIAEKAQDKESATYAFVQAAGKAVKNNPDFVEHVLKPLLTPVSKAPAGKSGTAAKKPTGKNAAKKSKTAASKPAKPKRTGKGKG
jgi:hypothetical protein